MIWTGLTSESDALASEIDRQRDHERIKKDGGDVNEDLRRRAVEDAEDAEDDSH
jgi:hypothetical protein